MEIGKPHGASNFMRHICGALHKLNFKITICVTTGNETSLPRPGDVSRHNEKGACLIYILKFSDDTIVRDGKTYKNNNATRAKSVIGNRDPATIDGMQWQQLCVIHHDGPVNHDGHYFSEIVDLGIIMDDTENRNLDWLSKRADTLPDMVCYACVGKEEGKRRASKRKKPRRRRQRIPESSSDDDDGQGGHD